MASKESDAPQAATITVREALQRDVPSGGWGEPLAGGRPPHSSWRLLVEVGHHRDTGAPGGRVRRVRAELQCHQCSDVTELVAEMDPHLRVALQFRCARCGGPMFLADVEARELTVPPQGMPKVRSGRKPRSQEP